MNRKTTLITGTRGSLFSARDRAQRPGEPTVSVAEDEFYS